MERKTDLINKAMEKFGQTTRMKVMRRMKVPDVGRHAPDGLVRIQHENKHWDFAIQVKTRITRTTVAIEKAQLVAPVEDRIVITEYMTPPLADLMKEIGLFFMDLAGNAYINKPPIYVFVKGNKLAEELKPAAIKRLFNACWGGEVAAAKITKQLKPERVIIYAPEPTGKLIIEKKLRKTTTGDIEILKRKRNSSCPAY